MILCVVKQFPRETHEIARHDGDSHTGVLPHAQRKRAIFYASARIPFSKPHAQIRPDLLTVRYLCSLAPLFNGFILAYNRWNVKDFSKDFNNKNMGNKIFLEIISFFRENSLK